MQIDGLMQGCGCGIRLGSEEKLDPAPTLKASDPSRKTESNLTFEKKLDPNSTSKNNPDTDPT